jgi:hypothetical protein
MKPFWGILASIVLVVILVPIARSGEDQKPTRQPAGPTLRIVYDKLLNVDDGDCRGCLYAVKGSIYNPNNDAVKNVVITYRVWKSLMGQEGHNSNIKDSGAPVSATIKYLPPKVIVEFDCSGTAPAMTAASGLVPDAINAEITAEWESQ